MDKFKALIAEFKDFCERYNRCAECPFYEYETASECIARFVFNKLTMGRTDPATPAVEEKEKVLGLPEWCKAGAWLITGVCPGVFFRVDDADEEFTVLVCEDGSKRVEHSSCLSEDYRPLPFQMYSLGEAIKLIGQLMVVTGERAEVIHSVSLDSTTGDVIINYLPVDHYRLKRPTINGIPFGRRVLVQMRLWSEARGRNQIRLSAKWMEIYMANMNCKHCTDMRQVMRLGEKYWVTKCSQFPGERRRLHDSCGSGWCEQFEEKFPKQKKKGE